MFRVEACTQVGCTSSPSVRSRTQKRPPEGDISLTVNVSSSRSVRLHWTPVAAANGPLRYDVYFNGPFYIDEQSTQFHASGR